MDRNASTDDIANEELLVTSELEILEVEAELDEISKLVSTNAALLGGEDVAELLQRLSSADDVAQGMEEKLDNVLENLDKLLAVLGVAENSLGNVDEAESDQSASAGIALDVSTHGGKKDCSRAEAKEDV